MKNVLFISSSISGENGNSTKLAKQFLAALPANSFQLTTIDLNTDPVTHLDMTEAGAWFTPAEQRTTEQKALAAVSDDLIEQVKAADLIVVGVPMYNFAIPSQLKAFLDRLARAGVTFKYTATGSVGLLEDKPVVLLAARGGIYKGTPADTQTPYLTAFFNFIGLKSLHFVYAEGLNMGPEAAESALSKAASDITALATTLSA